MKRFAATSSILLMLLLRMVVAVSAATHPLSRRVQIHNVAGEHIAIEWVNPKTGENISLASSTRAGDTLSLNSFVNHTLLVRDLIGNSTPIVMTVAPDEEEQMMMVHKHLKLERQVSLNNTIPMPLPFEKRQAISDMIEQCHLRAKTSAALGQSALHTLQKLENCLVDGTTELFMRQNEELSFQRDLRRLIAKQTENYTCSDPTLETTKPMRETEWTYNGTMYNVGILHEHTASHIHVVNDFITPAECRAIQDAAEPLLHRGTVADGKGGSTMSTNRKAWQAGLKTLNNEPILHVKQRLFAYANHAVGFNMSLAGQEDIMSIQYFGANSSDCGGTRKDDCVEDVHNKTNSFDQYMPHCDGDCTSALHKPGGRVATMVMYCDVPDAGSGATNFQQANVFVKPKQGAAVFFAYLNPTTGLHDEGFTTHSGCPVRAGTKRIAVQWMRVGVDEANPWDSFDTNNVKKN